jgi:hypothetical protein
VNSRVNCPVPSLNGKHCICAVSIHCTYALAALTWPKVMLLMRSYNRHDVDNDYEEL